MKISFCKPTAKFHYIDHGFPYFIPRSYNLILDNKNIWKRVYFSIKYKNWLDTNISSTVRLEKLFDAGANCFEIVITVQHYFHVHVQTGFTVAPDQHVRKFNVGNLIKIGY